MSVNDKLSELGIELPALGGTIGTFVHSRRVGPLLFLSGKGPLYDDGVRPRGKVGVDMDVDAAYGHARRVGLLLIAAMKEAVDGDLDRVEAIVKVLGLVNSATDFIDQFKVVNGCSDLFVEVFGDKGWHARTVAGVSSLPNGIPVEIEAIVAIR
jgi:enamine deaminase RidA (YjgF/YER057c/UK114 family)